MYKIIDVLIITYYSCALTILIAFISTFIRIFNTSKSTFAYILLTFTAIYAICELFLGLYWQFSIFGSSFVIVLDTYFT